MGILITQRRLMKSDPVNNWVLQAADTTKWIIVPDANGILKAVSGATGSISDVKVTGGSSSEASFAISNNGELQVKNGGDLSGTATLNDNFRLRSSDGSKIFKLAVNGSDQIQTIEV